MMDVGRVCIKKAGRDASLSCVVIDVIDEHFVLIDGETRRRKCNVAHLSPTEKVVSLEKGASHDAVKSALAAEGMKTTAKKSKKPAAKPIKKRAVKAAKV